MCVYGYALLCVLNNPRCDHRPSPLPRKAKAKTTAKTKTKTIKLYII